MGERYEIKSEFQGPEAHMAQELQVLNRVLRWTDVGIEYEADQRHAKLIIREMGMVASLIESGLARHDAFKYNTCGF